MAVRRSGEIRFTDLVLSASSPASAASPQQEAGPVVFLCHNHVAKPAVKRIGKQLAKRGLRPWLDEWNLRPGVPWQRALEQEIRIVDAAAVFVDESGIGPWQNMEIEALLRELVRRNCPVIPVILPSCPETPELPPFLAGNTWVDFRKRNPRPLEQLIFGITGSRGD